MLLLIFCAALSFPALWLPCFPLVSDKLLLFLGPVLAVCGEVPYPLLLVLLDLAVNHTVGLLLNALKLEKNLGAQISACSRISLFLLSKAAVPSQ